MIYEVNDNSLDMPSACTWSLYFVSSDESGRDNITGLMNIDDIAQKRKLSGVTWAYPDKEQATRVLQLFMQKRFMTIKYDDLLSGNIETRTFYMSDPSAPVYRWNDGMKIYTSLGFDLIER